MGVHPILHPPDLGTQEDEELDAEAGLDVRYRLREGLTLGLILNTDFSRGEVNPQQIRPPYSAP